VFECVLNISEGRNHDLLETLRATAGISLRDYTPISSTIVRSSPSSTIAMR